ncbi:MAG: aminopeptidase P family protein [Thermoleophilia bacterium]|nr:aminopeptidase P family protein [Thermoleophilia bacterium]
MTPRQERALELARTAGADALLAAHPSTVTWLTGFVGDIETGPSPFSLPALAVLANGEPPTLVVSDDDAGAAAELGCRAVTYTGFTVEPLEPVAGAARALARAVGGRRVATEPGALPAALAHGLDLVDVTAAIARSRAVKDPDELDAIRAAIALCDAGQRAAREVAAPGLTELELWAAIRAAIELAAGARTPLLADLVSGPRTAEVGGPPGPRVLAAGEPVLCDLVPRLAGYWGDCCATFAVGGEPAAPLAQAHRKAREALTRAVEAVRPGARAGELDAAIRPGLEYPHHTGHGLGTAYHEEPRIVPGGETVLEPGMVVALEPGSYGDGGGVRVEQVVLVTADGCEILSGHALEL